MTQLCRTLALAATIVFPGLAAAVQEATYPVYTGSPRLLLGERRLRLLKRERQRSSPRWEQFDALISGGARLSEPGFAKALWGAVASNPQACREAAGWAVSSNDIRQAALVYDWCRPSLPADLATRLSSHLAASLSARGGGVTEVRARVLAAIAIYDDQPAQAEAVLKQAIEDWWQRQTAPRLQAGDNTFSTRAELYALVELLHVVRDNLKIDLRESAPRWFDELPVIQILSYYPQSWPSAENDYHVPAYWGDGDPDLREASLSRAAELALVAYDGNAQPHQFLQGWLMQDRFQLRSEFGVAYEFLWANPYQPGLSYSYMPDLFHARGQLLVRSSWDEDATWFCYARGRTQAFVKGRRGTVKLTEPLSLGVVRVFVGTPELKFETGWLPAPEPGEKTVEEVAFIVGLQPGAAYDVEVDDEEMFETHADSGGIVELRFKPGRRAGVRIHPPR